MGWEPLEPESEEVIGDEPFDLMAAAIEAVAEVYQHELDRKPSVNEILTTFKQSLETRMYEVAAEGEDHQLVSVSYRLKKIPKRQRYRVGDVLRGTLANGEYVFARVFDEPPLLGPHIGVYDSKGMDVSQLELILSKALIVKITPIHRDNLRDRTQWLVLANRPLSKADQALQRGPVAIGGDNLQLWAANYYYGFRDDGFYDIEKWIVRGSQDETN